MRQVADSVYWIEFPVGNVYVWDWTELERPLAEQLFGDVSTLPGPQPAAVVVDREVDDGAVTLGGGTIVGVPGHTPGSLARPADRVQRGPQAVGDGAQPVTEA